MTLDDHTDPREPDEPTPRAGKRTLRRAILMMMLVPAALVALVGGGGIWALEELTDASMKILSHNYASIAAANEMLAILCQTAPGEPPHADERGAFEEALALAADNITEEGEEALVQSIAQSWASLVGTSPQGSTVGSTAPPAGDDAAVATGPSAGASASGDGSTASPSTFVLVQTVEGHVESLIALNEASMAAHGASARRLGTAMMITISALALAALVTLLVFTVVAAKRISRPISRAARALHEALSQDEPSTPPPPHAANEITQLTVELDELLERLHTFEEQQARRLSLLEAELAFVFEEVSDGLVLMDGAMQVRAFDETARRVLPLSDAAVGGPLVGPHLDESSRHALEPLVSGGDTGDAPSLRATVDDEERLYRPRLMPFEGSDGATEGYLLVLWDVTAERRFEEARQKFVAMLSHQLKTPMTSLTMAVELLREKLTGSTDETDELLEMASLDCKQLASLTKELIGAAKRRTSSLSVTMRDIDVHELVRYSMKPLRVQAEEKGISLVEEYEPRATHALVDPVKLPWVVTNIVGNALRYTAPGGQVTLTSVMDDGSLVMTIGDTGKGILPDDIERLFRPFSSFGTMEERGSLGLGLSIAKEIVEAHAGTIEVASEPGAGTTFTIRIPRFGEGA